MAKKRGRPPSFDRTIALNIAMEIFWNKGYENTQLIDLTTAMGINPPSFYATFESKASLFYEVVQLYIDRIGNKTLEALNSSNNTKEAIRAMLNSAIDNATSCESGGCMMILGVVYHRPENQAIWEYLKKERVRTLGLIHTRLLRGINDGELPKHTDAEHLAQHFLGVTQAISFQARDGASREHLQKLIEPALMAFGEHNENCRQEQDIRE